MDSTKLNLKICPKYLTKYLGATVKLSTYNCEVFQGELSSIDLGSRICCLDIKKKMANGRSKVIEKVIPLSECIEIELIKKTDNLAELKETTYQDFLKMRYLRKLTDAGYEISENNDMSHVPQVARELFKAISRLFSAADIYWRGNEIVILNSVIIKPDYTVSSIIIIGDGQNTAEYIKEVVNRFHALKNFQVLEA